MNKLIHNQCLLYYFFIASFSVTAQITPNKTIFTNYGGLYITPKTQIHTYYDFENQETGKVFNDGMMSFYGNYLNNGLFTYRTNSQTGLVEFKGQGGVAQEIKGEAPSSFYNISFDKTLANYSFHLANDFSVEGTANLTNGVVFIDQEKGGSFLFSKGARQKNASKNSHFDGMIIKEGNDAFQFPLGNKGKYRPAGISVSPNLKDVFLGRYIYEDEVFFKQYKNKSSIIELVDEKEYWIIEKQGKNQEGIMLTLSWSDETTPTELLSDPELNLHIVRWDAEQEMWVDEGGVVDVLTKEITTPAQVSGYGYFTLGRIKPNKLLEGDIVIYNLVSANGDGRNDYFKIDKIQKFPDNKVEIYNRWGTRVYETKNYDSNGNVFRGNSEGKGTLGKGGKLPTGTYFYIVTYQYKDANGSRPIKKSGYLHLETN
ncbi:gliding motility-associated C-terminal domain-containing protein [Myroides odoratus]|uniref:Gliding motility-associated C-terminal domain-containing protein n=1 Tax=Myroides odoratus TaxID=256 RepID=A0A9Q7E9S7_MYROD|nr:gliding motility-associated C-terminal domain-containing protein [Myroides odoratus]EHQ44250.1 hypothetical protein Myrod_3446 [Myroides odoratus DSM 2801]EKB05855.1 hypothetical protein HMPREF9716_02648 [Myroides odoratus CIP 103059]QQU01532.1 gliding motility-associated C-terminal domain-containing protein [Myroides odoratus]WQD56198.1 gliding motility-associated C-terminal domain-containing protein [Myroides odoratus]STZ31587.1 gliding motility-associated C-terminal domain [Myroides odor